MKMKERHCMIVYDCKCRQAETDAKPQKASRKKAKTTVWPQAGKKRDAKQSKAQQEDSFPIESEKSTTTPNPITTTCSRPSSRTTPSSLCCVLLIRPWHICLSSTHFRPPSVAAPKTQPGLRDTELIPPKSPATPPRAVFRRLSSDN